VSEIFTPCTKAKKTIIIFYFNMLKQRKGSKSGKAGTNEEYMTNTPNQVSGFFTHSFQQGIGSVAHHHKTQIIDL